MASSRNGGKTGGLRYLWIPGRKRSHPKGRYDATNKRINYNTGQKRSEPWSLGGSKGQKDLLKAEADGLDSGPSISGLLPISCAAGVPVIATSNNMPVLAENKLEKWDEDIRIPSPLRDLDHDGTVNNHIPIVDSISDSATNHNLKKIDGTIDCDLPSPPKCNGLDTASENSPHKRHSSTNNKKTNNNNRTEVDINSIESVSETKPKRYELDLPDGIHSISNLNDAFKKNKNKKKKKNKNKNSINNGESDEEDDKIVKCLYYTLMCCECTVS